MSIKMEQRKKKKARAKQHRLSILAVSGVMLVLAVTLLVASSSLNEKKDQQIAEEAGYKSQIKEQKELAEEIDTLEDVMWTDSYIEDIAREKLGLVHENEILFEAEP